MKFNAAPLAVQLAALWVWKGLLGVDYLAATAIAVEIAVAQFLLARSLDLA